jgi:tetratricopeptide (TPR) repeat protein
MVLAGGLALMGRWGVWAGEIHGLVEKQDLQAVQQFLAAHPEGVNERGDKGLTPLHVAIGLNNVDIVRLLLTLGADVKAASDDGTTPLHWAAFMNARDVVALLIEKGADANVRDRKGQTPLQVALNENAREVVALLTGKSSTAYTAPFLDARYLEGEKARQSGDSARAYEIFNQLVREHPESEEINFAYGMACLALGDLSRAQLAFERVLQINARNDRARVELARTYVETKQYELATREFETVLSHNPPLQVRRNIEQYLRDVRSGKSRWRFAGRVEAGGLWDDNVNVGPASETVNIAPVVFGSQTFTTLSVNDDSQPLDSAGVFASASVAGTYDPGETAGWVVPMTASFYENWLEDGADYETRYYQAVAGSRCYASSHVVDMPVKLAHIDSGDDALVDILGVIPSHVAYQGQKRNLSFTTAGSLEARNYDSLDDRDGEFYSLGETVRKVLGEGRHEVSCNLAVFLDDTDAGIYRNSGLSLSLFGDFAVVRSLRTYGRLRFQDKSYDEREELAPEKREDSQVQLMVGLRSQFNRWGVDLNYQYTDNGSSFDLYEYTRNVVTLTTSCNF